MHCKIKIITVSFDLNKMISSPQSAESKFCLLRPDMFSADKFIKIQFTGKSGSSAAHLRPCRDLLPDYRIKFSPVCSSSGDFYGGNSAAGISADHHRHNVLCNRGGKTDRADHPGMNIRHNPDP